MKQWKILVVDDEPNNLMVLRGILAADYHLSFARSGSLALETARKHNPDLILLDIMMPGIDGYKTCQALKADAALAQVPVIFVTAITDIGDEAKGFEVGGVDYITKPVSPPIVKARVAAHIARVTQETVLDRLGVAGDYRDNETGAHVRRIGRYSQELARRLGLGEMASETLLQTAPMHDIGKVGVPDAVLLKPGPLNEEELAVMRRHPEIGAEIIGVHSNTLMHLASQICMTHHEHWNGGGYPKGLIGEDIPIEGRIVAIADVFDALLAKRPYKDPWPLPKVVEFIQTQAGSHFDPNIVPVFLEAVDALKAIHSDLPDQEGLSEFDLAKL